jgi:hypothetical protein
MSFYNNKVTKYRMCPENAEEKKELTHMFGKFSKYFQCDSHYDNLQVKTTTPVLSSKVGCYNGVDPNKKVLSSSELTQNRVSKSVLDKPHANVCSRVNNASDRALSSTTTLDIPSHGNSVKRTLTSHRPGAQSGKGEGVDIKHNSYYRHNMRVRGQILTDEMCPDTNLVVLIEQSNNK